METGGSRGFGHKVKLKCRNDPKFLDMQMGLDIQCRPRS